MASIYKIGKRYRVEFRHNGKRYTSSFPTKRECQEWIVTKTVELSTPVAENKTLLDALNDYMEKVSPKKKAEQSEINRIKYFIRSNPELCAKRMSDIKSIDIADWRDRRLKSLNPATGKQVKPNTVHRDMTWLSSVFRTAHKEWGWITENPVSNVKWPQQTPPRDRLITDKEIDAMLVALGYVPDSKVSTVGQRVACALLFALETALRSQEICLLEWEDIEGRVLDIKKSKTHAGERRVPLSSRAMEILEQLDKESNPVFGLTTSQLSSNFRRARDLAGLTGFTFHDSRANAITNLAQKLEILDLARVIGHKDLKMLMVYYRKKADELVDKLD